ncbi:MAG: PEP-CTERM sorting domain-containing protein [Desulfobaccales bacterium]
MLRKALMLLVVAGVLAWTAASQAAAIPYYFSEYYGDAYATDGHHYDEHNFTTALPPGSTSASEPNASAYASAGMNGHNLYMEGAATGAGTEAGSTGAHIDLRFYGPASGQVTFQFDYYGLASCSGSGSAEIDLNMYFANFTSGSNLWAIVPTAAVSVPAGALNGDSQSVSDHVNETFTVTPGTEYELWLEVWWAYAINDTAGNSAFTQGYFDNLSVDDGTVGPPPPDPTPAPATWLLLSSGLSALLIWRRKR